LPRLGALVFVIAAAALGWFWPTGPDGPDATGPIRMAPLTSDPGYEAGPSFAPDGNRIVYQNQLNPGTPEETWDLFIMAVDAGVPQQLTDDPANAFSPAWSPSSELIAYVQAGEDSCTINGVLATGGMQRYLGECTPGAWVQMAWSPDGRTLAVAEAFGPAPAGIRLLDIESGESRQVTTPPMGYMSDIRPAFSADGTRLAFVRSRAIVASDIYVMELPDGVPRRVTDLNEQINSVAWDADDNLTYSSNLGGNFKLWRAALSGRSLGMIPTSGRNATGMTLSADGKRIVYEDWMSDMNIWAHDLAGDETTPLIDSTQWDYSPTFSPDGTELAFVSDRTGDTEVWISDAQGNDPRRVTFLSGVHVGSVDWSPDGTALLIDAAVDGNFDVYRISPQGGVPERLTDSEFQDRWPIWSHDGSSFFFSSNREGPWDLWRQDSDGGEPKRLTFDGGAIARQAEDGRIYFSKPDVPGLWHLRLGGGDELALRGLKNSVWKNWALSGNGLYFLNANDYPSSVEHLNLISGERTRLFDVRDFQEQGGLAVSPDGARVVYTQIDRSESDLWLVEDF
jgi:Tol biopolymer transport system component